MAPRFRKIVPLFFVFITLAFGIYYFNFHENRENGFVEAGNREVAEPILHRGDTRNGADVPYRSPDGNKEDSSRQNGASKKNLTIRSVFPTDHPFKNDLDSMKARAMAGDDQAAVQLYVDLETCHSILGRAEEFERSNGTNVPEDIRKSTQQSLAKQLKNCEGVSREDTKDFVKWLDMAAKRGDYQAQIMWIDSFFSDKDSPSTWMLQHPDEVKEYKNQAMEYLDQLAKRCSLDALSMLIGQYHVMGVLTEKDPYRAYQYYLIYRSVAPESAESYNIADMERSLSSEQIEQAQIAANKFRELNCR